MDTDVEYKMSEDQLDELAMIIEFVLNYEFPVEEIV